jgi:DNA modification methylase
MKLMQGDCLERMKEIPDGSVDMVCADLPYGTTSCKWDSVIPLDALWAEYKRVCKPSSAIVLTACQPFTATLVMSNPKWFKHEWIWHKSKSGSAFTAKVRPMAKHESIIVFGRGRVTYNPQMVKGEPYSRTRKPPPINNHKLGLGSNGESTTVNNGTRYPESVQFFQQKWRRQDQVHPTQKPVALMEYMIRTYTNDGGTVLDNTMGSGTTGVACANLGRDFIGIEKDLDYFNIALTRIEEAITANATPCESSDSEFGRALSGAWGITDGEGYLTYGGSRERAKDIMWSMQNESEDWRGKNLFLVWCEWEEFNKPTPWFPPPNAEIAGRDQAAFAEPDGCESSGGEV